MKITKRRSVKKAQSKSKRRSTKKIQSKSKRRSTKKIQSKSKRRSTKKIQSKSKRRSTKKVKSKSKKRSTKKIQSGGGGELDAVLIYGPTENLNIDEWVTKLLLDNESKKNIIKNSISNISKKLPIEMVDEICRYIKNDEKENKIDDFFKLLVKNNLTNVFLNNYDYENFRIGFIVKNYEKFLEKDKNDVDKFCKKYKLKKPTFFGALVGELE
jgi:hypothetical protein